MKTDDGFDITIEDDLLMDAYIVKVKKTIIYGLADSVPKELIETHEEILPKLISQMKEEVERNIRACQEKESQERTY